MTNAKSKTGYKPLESGGSTSSASADASALPGSKASCEEHQSPKAYGAFSSSDDLSTTYHESAYQAEYLDMKWAIPESMARHHFDKAGVDLRKPVSTIVFEEAARIVGNWRSAHAYPLHAITMSLRTRVNKTDPDGIVVQRLKRLASILPKLSKSRLTQIQDIGGCRAVVKDLDHLNRLHKKYMDAALKSDSRRPYMDRSPDNYITNPKADGYRAIHYVFRYRSEQEEFKVFNGMKVEVQLRTRVQHAWATAVEIVDLFTGQSIKTDIKLNKADPRWKRFFVLMGTVIAIEENCPEVPGTSSKLTALRKELKELSHDLDAVTKLQGYGQSVSTVFERGGPKSGGAYLIRIDAEKRLLTVNNFSGKKRKELDEAYIREETQFLVNPHVQVAQVKARDFKEFKRGYPNYDLDTRRFVDLLHKNLSTRK